MSLSFLRFFGLCAAGAAFLACTSEQTGLVVFASTQARVPKDLVAATITVRSGPRVVACRSVSLDAPVSVEVSGADGEELTVDVAGFTRALEPDSCDGGGEKPRVERHAQMRLSRGVQLYLPMQLRWGCFDAACSAGQTCEQGACVSDQVDPTHLVAYDGMLTSGSASYCLPRSLCFDHRAPALLVDPARCEYQLPDGMTLDQGINVELVQDTLAREVLDANDPAEGFSVDPKAPSKFTLAPALCERIQQGKISAVSAGVGCPSKTVFNPMCTDPGKTGDGHATEAPETCTQPAELAPSPSALYFLFDRSASTKTVLSRDTSDALSFPDLVRLALATPALAASRIAFESLPGTTDACGGANQFTSPEVPFSSSADAAAAITQKLSDPTQFLTSNPPLYLDAALQPNGAYWAFSLLPQGSVAQQRTVIVGSHDLWTGCTSSGAAGATPADESFRAYNQRGVRTDVLLFGVAPGTPVSRDPFVDATAISRMGAGIFFDASVDSSLAGQAFAQLVSEAASCFYDLPSTTDRTHLAETKVAYFDVAGGGRVDISYNAACSEKNPYADGWNLEGPRVRVCGNACGGLRGVLQNAIQYAIGHHVTPPRIPLHWAPRCR
ncbi:MAG TPA: hypothetical protein VNO21_12615 [Polyangiaceae bacterium]|nr:hypothetical protein [Polyangiaceae bacterium]